MGRALGVRVLRREAFGEASAADAEPDGVTRIVGSRVPKVLRTPRGDDLVDEVADDGPRVVAEQRLQPVRERVGDDVARREAEARARGLGPRGVVDEGRLGADDLQVRPQALGVDRDARDEAAAADGDDQRVQERRLLEELDGDGALARDDVGVVGRVHEAAADLGALGRRGLGARGVRRRAQRDTRAVARDGGPLHGRRRVGHDDVGVAPQELRGEGDGLGVVPAAVRHERARGVL